MPALATSFSGGSTEGINQFYGSFLEVLPYIKQGNVANLYDPNKSYSDTTVNASSVSNADVLNSPLKIYSCPSDAISKGTTKGWGSYSWSGGNNGSDRYTDMSAEYFGDPIEANTARSTYVTTINWEDGYHDRPIGNSREGPVRWLNVTDGTSNTLLAGETSWVLENWTTKRVTQWGAAHYPRSHVSTNVRHNTKKSPLGCNPNIGSGPMRTVVSLTDPTNWINNGCFAFRSPHNGGVNFVFCDGSVKFVKETIPLALYKSLGSRAGERYSMPTTSSVWRFMEVTEAVRERRRFAGRFHIDRPAEAERSVTQSLTLITGKLASELTVPDLERASGVTAASLDDRVKLLANLEKRFETDRSSHVVDALQAATAKAVRLMKPEAADSFDLN